MREEWAEQPERGHSLVMRDSKEDVGELLSEGAALWASNLSTFSSLFAAIFLFFTLFIAIDIFWIAPNLLLS